MHKPGFTRHLATIVATFAFSSASVAATAYPERPIEIIVGYKPGGASTILAHAFAEVLSKDLGQPVVIINKPGANSNVALAHVKAAKPDGYTLAFESIGNTVNPALYDNVPFDIIKNFDHIAMFGESPDILIVNANRPYRTLQEYIEYAKANPNKVECGSSGSGSSSHLACELFQRQAGVKLLHVPYNGQGPEIVDLVGNHIASAIDNLGPVVGHIKSGALRPLAMTTDSRIEDFPDVPTMEEAGVDGVVVSAWWGLAAPKGTPPEILKRLNASVVGASQDPKIKEFMKNNVYLAIEPSKNTQEAYTKHVTSELEKWGRVVREADIKLD